MTPSGKDVTMTAMFRSRTRLVRALVLLTVGLGMLGPAPVVGDVSIDVIVGWTAPFEERTDLTAVPDASHETILANQDDSVVVANGDLAPAGARLAAFEALGADPDTLVNVDAGTSGDPQYWLDLLTVAEEPYGAFALARTVETGVTLTLFLGPVATFADGMAQAQAAVLVDGEPLFDGVEPGGLQALLEAELPALDSAGADDDADDAVATEDAAEDTEATPDESGLVGDGAYVSPHHGVALTWTEAWVLDPAFEEPVTSDVNYDVDQVYLTVDSPQWVWFTLVAADTQGFSFAEIFRSVATSSYVEQLYGEDAELVVSRMGVTADGDEAGAFIVRFTTPEGYELVAYEEWRLADDGRAVAQLQLLMLVDDMGPGLEASDDLEFEGGPVITLFTHDEILAAAQGTETL
jgi:hypothetical protein